MYVKKILFLLVLLFSTASFSALGQGKSGSSAFELLSGVTHFGYSGVLGYAYYPHDRWIVRFDFNYTIEQSARVEHTALGMDIIGGYTIRYFTKQELYLTALAGLTASQEDGKWGGYDVEFSELKYGAIGGVELEKYLNLKWSLVLNFQQRYLTNKEDLWGDLRWYGQVGVRFNIVKLDETYDQ